MKVSIDRHNSQLYVGKEPPETPERVYEVFEEEEIGGRIALIVAEGRLSIEKYGLIPNVLLVKPLGLELLRLYGLEWFDPNIEGIVKGRYMGLITVLVNELPDTPIHKGLKDLFEVR